MEIRDIARRNLLPPGNATLIHWTCATACPLDGAGVFEPPKRNSHGVAEVAASAPKLTQ